VYIIKSDCCTILFNVYNIIWLYSDKIQELYECYISPSDLSKSVIHKLESFRGVPRGFQETPTKIVSSKQSPGQCVAIDLFADIKSTHLHWLLQQQICEVCTTSSSPQTILVI